MDKPVPAPFSPADMSRRKRRAIAMALVLLGFAVLFFVTTIVRIGGTIGERSL